MESYALTTKPNSSHIATFFLTTLLLLTFITSPIAATTTTTTTATTTAASSPLKASLKFIKTSCNKTTYASLCYKTLSPYSSTIKTNPLILCDTAISVTIEAANATSATVTKYVNQKKGITNNEAGPIKDCIVNLKDTIYRLKECLKAMSKLSGPDKEFQMSNAKTWASAALTDEGTCQDALSGSNVNPDFLKKIGGSIEKVDELNSNALFFINHLDY